MNFFKTLHMKNHPLDSVCLKWEIKSPLMGRVYFFDEPNAIVTFKAYVHILDDRKSYKLVGFKLLC